MLNRFIDQFSRMIYRLEDLLFDFKYNIRTSKPIIGLEGITIESEFIANGQPYQGAYLRNVRKLLKVMYEEDTSHGVETYIDLGCGLGRTCFYAYTTGKFKTVLGVDFGKEFIKQANVFQIKTFNFSNIQFIEKDVAKLILPDTNSFLFAFNPFDAVVFEKLFLNNIQTLKNNKIYLGYSNDRYAIDIQNYFSVVYRDPKRKLSLWVSK